MFCQKCGNQLVEGAEFCQKCGNKFVVAEATREVPVESVSVVEPIQTVVSKADSTTPEPEQGCLRVVGSFSLGIAVIWVGLSALFGIPIIMPVLGILLVVGFGGSIIGFIVDKISGRSKKQ